MARLQSNYSFVVKLPNGQPVVICFGGTAKNENGHCDHPSSKPRYIRINKKTRGRERLNTIVHELIHAYDFRFGEERVDELATLIADALWIMGYRCDVKKIEPVKQSLDELINEI